MAIAYNPRIVTDGLVLSLDAANTKSYPGSGTTWTDLSGEGYDGTISGATYTSGVDGYFDFDGTNDLVTVNSSIRTAVGEFLATSSNSFSISVWFEPTTSDTSSNTMFSKANGYGTAGNIILGYDGTNLLSVIRGTSTNNFYTSLTSTWHEVAICWDGTTFKSYVNGSFVSNLSVGSATSQDTDVKIGNSGNGNEPFNGKISNVKVYTKALSASEIQQNYNALRGRYGI